MASPPEPLRRRAVEATLANNLLVVALLLEATFLLVVGSKLVGVDSWLTLAAGREIVQHGLPHHEVLTTIPAGRPWIDQQWLAQLVFYRLDQIGGIGLAVVFHGLMVTAALAISMVASRVRGASSTMTLLAAIVCLLVAPMSWQLRAQSIALPLFALTLALVSTDSRLVRRRTFLVFPTLVVWANVHGSVILGAVLVSLAGVLGLLDLILRRRRATVVPAWRPALFLVAPWACVLVSPYGTGLVDYYRLLFFDSPVSRYITEWQAPKPHGYLLVFFVVAAATVVIVIWQRRRLSLYDIGVLALTLAGACRSVRAVVWFSLALAVLLPLALDGIVRPRPAPPVHRRLAAGLIGVMAAALAATAVFTLTRSEASFEQGKSLRGARATVRAALATDAVVWSSGTYANWLLWKEPRLRGRIAWDVRFELLTDAELRAIVRFNSYKPGWRAATRGYRLLVLDRHAYPRQTRAILREPGSYVLFRDKAVVVLARPRR